MNEPQYYKIEFTNPAGSPAIVKLVPDSAKQEPDVNSVDLAHLIAHHFFGPAKNPNSYGAVTHIAKMNLDIERSHKWRAEAQIGGLTMFTSIS